MTGGERQIHSVTFERPLVLDVHGRAQQVSGYVSGEDGWTLSEDRAGVLATKPGERSQLFPWAFLARVEFEHPAAKGKAA